MKTYIGADCDVCKKDFQIGDHIRLVYAGVAEEGESSLGKHFLILDDAKTVIIAVHDTCDIELAIREKGRREPLV